MHTKILLIYIGQEQAAWGDIAYRREYHYYIMPGILYLQAMLERDAWVQSHAVVTCRYFNRSVQDREAMLQAILAEEPALCGFSTFCWNREDVLFLASEIKARRPETRIVCGGPEVGELDGQGGRELLHRAPAIDGLVFGEAEQVVAPMVRALLTGDWSVTAATPGIALRSPSGSEVRYDGSINHCPDLEAIPSIYPMQVAVPRTDACGLAMVYESVRGCPYRCIYCHFGRQNHALRRFGLERVKRELQGLLEAGIDCIHCADAVFDLDPARAKEMLTHLISHNVRTSLFFYCAFSRLDRELADLFEAAQAQIGVGIQSTNPTVLKTIQRNVNARLFLDKRDLLRDVPLNFYIDLIFGLPADTPASFRASFRDALQLNPAFLMMFPLTVVKGTELARNLPAYGVVPYGPDDLQPFHLACDIAYEHIALSRDFTLPDLERFDDVALCCFYYYNRFRTTLQYLQARCGDDPFAVYGAIGKQTKAYLRATGEKLSNTQLATGIDDTVKRIFKSVLAEYGVGPHELAAFEELFKLDVYRILIMGAPQRRKVFEANQALRQARSALSSSTDGSYVRASHGKTITLTHKLNDLLALSSLREDIAPARDTVHIHAPFQRWNADVWSVDALCQSILDRLSADRPTTYEALSKACARECKGGGLAMLDAALDTLSVHHVIRRVT